MCDAVIDYTGKGEVGLQELADKRQEDKASRVG
jgi:hypothetical protein